MAAAPVFPCATILSCEIQRDSRYSGERAPHSLASSKDCIDPACGPAMWSAKLATMHGAGAQLTDTEASRDGFIIRGVFPRIYLESLGFWELGGAGPTCGGP